MRFRLRPKLRQLRVVLLEIAGTIARAALGAAAGFVTVLFVFGIAVPFVTHHDYFRLRTVRVSCDDPTVSPRALASVAGLWHDSTVWQVDPEAARKSIETVPWVEKASVVRHFPWQVTVEVSRRKAVAATLAGDGVFLVDASGAVFREPGEERAPDLPFVRGWNRSALRGERIERLRTLMGVVQDATAAGYTVSEVLVDDQGDYWFYPEEPRVAVALGRNPRSESYFERLSVALEALEGNLGLAREIDVAAPRGVVVRTESPAASQALAARLAGVTAAGSADGKQEASDRG